MELIRIVLLFLLKVGVAGTFLAYLQLYLVPAAAPVWIHHCRWPLSFVAAFVCYLMDMVYFFPFFRSPYKALPNFREDYFGKTVFESPRGISALGWMRQSPDAEILRVDGPFNLPDLILAGPNALRDVLNTNSYDFQKSQGVRAFLSRILGYGLILSEGQEHGRQRKALTPAFNIRRIRELYGLMWAKTQILATQLENDLKRHPVGNDGFGVVEMSEWAGRLTLDIIGPTAMGRDFQSLVNEENPIAQAFIELLEPRLDGLVYFGAHWVLPEYILRMIPCRVNRDMNRICGFLRGTCRQIVAEKKAEIFQDKAAITDFDILSRVILSGEFDDELLIDQMLTFLAAGHETTANALTWACYLCAKYPHVQQKLRAEIRSNIPSSSSLLSPEVMETLPYLNGVCEETLRLYPTVPMTIREAIVDTTVAGVSVLKGTELLLIPYAINRHPRFWGEDADMIVPERWIDVAEDGTQRANKNGGTSTNFAEITFLHGPRSCIGRDFAKAELRCAVAGVLGKFEIQLDTTEEPVMTGVITTKPKGGLKMRLRPLDGW